MRQTALRLQQIVEQTEPRLLGIAQPEGRPSPAKWSKKEVLGHLIDSAANNHQRFVRSQLQRELALPGYAQADWNRAQQYQSEAWENMVRLWASYNRHLAHVMAAISESDRHNTCTIGEGKPVTLEFLVTDYVSHLEHHLRQIL